MTTCTLAVEKVSESTGDDIWASLFCVLNHHELFKSRTDNDDSSGQVQRKELGNISSKERGDFLHKQSEVGCGYTGIQLLSWLSTK